MSDPGLELTRESEMAQGEEIAVLRAAGDVDLRSAEELAGAMAQEPGDGALVVDLTEVPFMDSSGLRVLMLACSQRGDRFAVVTRPESPVMRVLELAGLTDRIATFPDRGQAAAVVAVAEPPA